MVSNKAQSPAKNILIENIYCNWSGGCGMGSLGADTDISDIVYRNIYTWKSNQMYMIKSNGGSGTVSNAVFENFIGTCVQSVSYEPFLLILQAMATHTPLTSTPIGAAEAKTKATECNSQISLSQTGKAQKRTEHSVDLLRSNAPTPLPAPTSQSRTLPCGLSLATSRPTSAAAHMDLGTACNRAPQTMPRTARR